LLTLLLGKKKIKINKAESIQEKIMGALVELVKPIIFAALNSCHTKKLVCDLLDRYVEKTDNDVDNVIAATVRVALMKGC
jgi:hypothetical protein